MRQEKFSYIDAESKVNLHQGLKDGTVNWDRSIDERRQDAKQQNKEIKNAILQEKEAQGDLQQTLAEAVQEARGAYDACARELEELQMTHKDFSELGGDLSDTGSLLEDLANSAYGAMNGQNVEDAKPGMNVMMRIQSLLQEEKRKRQALEDEALRLETELRQKQEQAQKQQQQRDQECRQVSALEQILQAQLNIGIPEILFRDSVDDRRGTVILDGAVGGSRANTVEEALRTVEVEFDKDGKLIRAMPHSKLGLQNEATDAVQLDDLPRLLTSVWHRLCCNAEKSGGPRRSRGGA
jgi:hypothetical protein